MNYQEKPTIRIGSYFMDVIDTQTEEASRMKIEIRVSRTSVIAVLGVVSMLTVGAGALVYKLNGEIDEMNQPNPQDIKRYERILQKIKAGMNTTEPNLLTAQSNFNGITILQASNVGCDQLSNDFVSRFKIQAALTASEENISLGTFEKLYDETVDCGPDQPLNAVRVSMVF